MKALLGFLFDKVGKIVGYSVITVIVLYWIFGIIYSTVCFFTENDLPVIYLGVVWFALCVAFVFQQTFKHR